MNAFCIGVVNHCIDWCRPLIMLPPTQCIAAFEEGSFLPLPSREAVERSIGKGGNGTITIVYFKGVEFAVKRVSVCYYMFSLWF